MFDEAQQLAITRTELDGVFYQNFDDYYTDAPSRATAQTADLFKPLETEHSAYIQEVYKGSPLFPAIGEVSNVPLSTPHVANKQTISVLDFAQGIEISKDLFDDNLHGVWAKTVEDFALKARRTQDFSAFGIFRGYITTTLTADGVAFGSAAHPLIAGGTVSNLNTGAGSALSTTSFNTAIVQLAQQKDQAGVVLGCSPSMIVVPTPLLTLAIQITESALVSDTANNALNVYRSAYGIKVLTSPYMDAVSGGSDTYWFLIAKNHSITRLIRQGIQTSLRSWEMSNNRTYFYQANYREAYFVSDYSGVICNAGV